MYKTIVIEYTPKAEDMAKKNRRKMQQYEKR